MKDFLSQAGKLLKEHKQYKRQLTVFLCLAVIVAFSTVTALKLYGQAMTHKMEVLDCQYQVHQHIEDCYAKDEQGNPGTELICGYADYAIHAHNEDCYDSKGNLVCGLEEHEKHEHTDECFTTELVLVCGLEEVIPEETPEDEAGETPEEPAGGEESTPEAAGQPEAEAPVVPEEESEPIQEEVLICQSEVHAHSEGCYEKALACGQEEHVHGEGCTSQELACGTEEHAHGEGCYDEEGNLTCEVQEHAHEEACYTTANVCGAEEHTHGDECYTTNLICGIEEHEHTESCYELVTVPAPADNGTTEPTVETPAADETAGEGSGAGAEPTEPAESTEPAEPESEAPAESEPEGHVHTEACYEEVKTLVCEEQELHIHDNSCYGPECFDENGALIEGSRVSCGLLQLEEHTHAHTEGEDSCFKTVELTPEEVEAAAKLANAHSFICRLPKGYDTMLTGDGAGLSQGQRQLLAIARAAIADPPVLILDEATSSIDTRTEKLVQQGMDALMQGRTNFVIAHRLSTIQNADEILVVNHGEIVEQGTHCELMEREGFYYQMYRAQFE